MAVNDDSWPTIPRIEWPAITANNFNSSKPPKPKRPTLVAAPWTGKSARRRRLEERWARKGRRQAKC